MRLELLAPICKREKKVTSTIFLPEASLSSLGGGVDRFYTKAFLSWSDLVCPSPTQAIYSSLPVLPPRWGGDAPGVDLMASLTDVQLLTIKTLLASDATWGAIRVTFQNASQAKTVGGNILITWLPVHNPEYIPDHSKTDMNIKLRCPFQASPHQCKSLLWLTKSQHYQRKINPLQFQSE